MENGQALAVIETSRNDSGLFSSPSVLNILRVIFAGAELSKVLTIIARLIETQGKGMSCASYRRRIVSTTHAPLRGVKVRGSEPATRRGYGCRSASMGSTFMARRAGT
jgi:hypothetical protein